MNPPACADPKGLSTMVTIIPEIDQPPTPAHPILDRWTAAVMLRLLGRMNHGTVVIEDGGTARRLGAGEPVVHVTVHDPRALGGLLRGSRGLADGYIRGWWECDDVTTLVRLFIRNLDRSMKARDRVARASAPLTDPIRRLRPPDKDLDRHHVRAHYDIGNDFYELMLDRTMAYSCAIFERPDSSLFEASTAKLDRLCRKLSLGPADHLIEIGTGWGSFALHAASQYGCRVTTTTISEAQYEYTAKRVADAGLGDRVTLLALDYRDLEGRFDKLVSIEMIEAVDWRDYGAFFSACSRLLEPDGVAALQAIVVADQGFDRSKHNDDFIRRRIFPGSCLPSVGAIAESVTQATDMRIIDLEDIGRHYAETLRRWRLNVREHEREVEAMDLGPAFRRMWELYLAYCEAAFLERHVSDVQVVMAKPGWQAPFTTRTV